MFPKDFSFFRWFLKRICQFLNTQKARMFLKASFYKNNHYTYVMFNHDMIQNKVLCTIN